jgi:hypothetical protein
VEQDSSNKPIRNGDGWPVPQRHLGNWTVKEAGLQVKQDLLEASSVIEHRPVILNNNAGKKEEGGGEKEG